MTRWVRTPPPNALKICEDHVRVTTVNSAEQARLTMAFGTSKTAEIITNLCLSALNSDKTSTEKIIAMAQPHIDYTTGEPTEHAPGSWDVPFVAYVSDIG